MEREVVERLVLFNLGKVPKYDLHQHEADKCFGRYLADREVCFHIIDLVLDGQVRATLDPLHFTLHAVTISAVCSTQHSAVDEKLVFAFRIDFSVALALVKVAVVRVVRLATGMQT